MTTLPAPSRSQAIVGGDRLIRETLFLATFLLTWFTLTPFPDLRNQPSFGALAEGNIATQLSTLLLTGALAIFVIAKRAFFTLRLETPALIATFCWFALSALFSAYPDVAARRLLLAVLTIFQAAAILVLPSGREHFARLLAVGAIIVLAACYFGVAFFPDYSVHHITDFAEPELAGDWHGLFGHKNDAGAAMVVLIFVGLFVARAWNALAGLLIVFLAGAFLFFTHSKSSLNLFPVALLLAYLAPRIRSPVAALTVILAVLALLNLFTVGSVVFAPIQSLVERFLSDPSFTGRDDIWRFTLDNVARRPLFGFGFEAFWGMPDLVATASQETWVYRATHAHNAYLNIAVTTGLVGLALSLLWVIMRPFNDYQRVRALGGDPALAMLFLQIWSFGLCLSSMEAVLFAGGSAIWFMMAMAIAGLRFQALATLNR